MSNHQAAADKLERFRMCVAEAGYDPAGANLMQFHDGSWGIDTDPALIPDYVAWRASELSIVDPDAKPICRRCGIHYATRREPCRGTKCQATRWLELDCGAPR